MKSLRESAGFTQDELATIAGLSVHAVSALERGQRRRPQTETIRALAAALDLESSDREDLARLARPPLELDRGEETDANLPLPPTPLVGREADVRALRSCLDDPAVRLVTVTGPGGAGKTRVALHVAHEIDQAGSARVRFVPLADVWTSAFAASAIAESLGLIDIAPADLARRAKAAASPSPTLLVVDNLEHLLDVGPLLADLLSAVGSLKILATSRAPLRLRGERDYAIGPLAIDVAPDADGVAPAVALFVDRVRDVRPEFRLTNENTVAVSTICRQLDALPLALELAAPWMKVLTADELSRRLERDILLPNAGARDLPERQQTMNATVAWSYRLLAPADREAFQRLGVLTGPFSIEAAAAVLAGESASSESTDAAIAAVGALIDKSLIQRVDGRETGRPLYRMLETVRAYAAAELSAAGGRDAAMEGLARHYAAEVTRVGLGLVGVDQIDWLDRVRDDLSVYRALLGWLLDNQRPNEAANLACHLMFFWIIRGHAPEGLDWYEQILASPVVSAGAGGRAAFAAAVTLYAQGDRSQARARLLQGRALAEAAKDDWTVVQIENLMGHVERADGHFDVARAHFTRGLAGFRAVGRRGATANALSGLAWVALATGDVEEAERCLDEADDAAHGSGPWFLMLPLYLRAIVAVRRGDADRAIELTRASLVHAESIQDRFIVVYALVPFAAAVALKGDDEWAARILGARDAVTEQSGSRVTDRSAIDLHDEAQREVRSRLGSERWSSAYQAGRRTTVGALIDEIDARLRRE